MAPFFRVCDHEAAGSRDRERRASHHPAPAPRDGCGLHLPKAPDQTATWPASGSGTPRAPSLAGHRIDDRDPDPRLREDIALPQLTAVLTERRSRGGSARLLLRGDGAVPARHVQAVVAAAAAAGVTEITFAALSS